MFDITLQYVLVDISGVYFTKVLPVHSFNCVVHLTKLSVAQAA
jgi:hypothetical protein